MLILLLQYALPFQFPVKSLERTFDSSGCPSLGGGKCLPYSDPYGSFEIHKSKMSLLRYYSNSTDKYCLCFQGSSDKRKSKPRTLIKKYLISNPKEHNNSADC